LPRTSFNRLAESVCDLIVGVGRLNRFLDTADRVDPSVTIMPDEILERQLLDIERRTIIARSA